ncbi:hypothetical protein ACFX12_029387 [Malus domestica]
MTHFSFIAKSRPTYISSQLRIIECDVNLQQNKAAAQASTQNIELAQSCSEPSHIPAQRPHQQKLIGIGRPV